jgi:hypothetical protein
LDRVGTDEFGKFMPEGTLFLFGLVTYDYITDKREQINTTGNSQKTAILSSIGFRVGV